MRGLKKTKKKQNNEGTCGICETTVHETQNAAGTRLGKNGLINDFLACSGRVRAQSETESLRGEFAAMLDGTRDLRWLAWLEMFRLDWANTDLRSVSKSLAARERKG